MGIFGLGPGEAARVALRRDLLLRVDTWPFADDPGYVYRGGADVVLLHGRWWQGARTPEKYLPFVGEPQRCFMNAMMAAEANPELTYVEGFYSILGGSEEHGWCIDEQGRVVELTVPTHDVGRCSIEGTDMPLLPPEHWIYVGVPIPLDVVRAAAGVSGFPLLGRSHARPPYNDEEIFATDLLRRGYPW